MRTRILALTLVLIAVTGAVVWFVSSRTTATQKPAAIADEHSSLTADSQAVITLSPQTQQSSMYSRDHHTGRIETFTETTVVPTTDSDLDTAVTLQQIGSMGSSFFSSGTEEYFSNGLSTERSVSAEDAFLLAKIHIACMSTPRTDWQYQKSLGWLTPIVESEEVTSGTLDWIDSRSRHLEVGYKICSGIDPAIKLDRAALYWLETAADLGHGQAQYQYYVLARNLLVGQAFLNSSPGGLVFEQPELIHEFKHRANAYVISLLKTGHPRALILMSIMLWHGDVYERDLVSAFAHLELVESSTTDQNILEDVSNMKLMIQDEVSSEELEAAKPMIRALRKRYRYE